MPYLIDGHNLIPKLGLRLDSPDDELDLVARLQEFCRLRRAQVEVYFDGAPPGQAAERTFGAVTAHFIRRGSSADDALEVRLEKLGRAARNWSMVSSDQRLQRAAQAAHAGVISAEEFSRQMSAVRRESVEQARNAGTNLSPEEVETWLSEFMSRHPKA
jgi:predicted RNA-binding protein with PIN domain